MKFLAQGNNGSLCWGSNSRLTSINRQPVRRAIHYATPSSCEFSMLQFNWFEVTRTGWTLFQKLANVVKSVICGMYIIMEILVELGYFMNTFDSYTAVNSSTIRVSNNAKTSLENCRQRADIPPRGLCIYLKIPTTYYWVFVRNVEVLVCYN